jgi:hypothetical protein
MFAPDISEVTAYIQGGQEASWPQEVIMDMAYHGRRTLMEAVACVDEATSRVELLPLVDTTGLGEEPLCYVLRGDANCVYYLDNFTAAAKAVRAINRPEYYSLSDKHALLTATRQVPLYTTYTQEDTRDTLHHAIGTPGCVMDIPRLIAGGVLTRDNARSFKSLGVSLDSKPHYFAGPVSSVVPVWRRTHAGRKYRVNTPATSAAGFTGYYVDDAATPGHIARTIYAYYTGIAQRVARHVMRISVQPTLVEDADYAQYKDRLFVDLLLHIKHGLCLHALGAIEREDALTTTRNKQFVYAVLHGAVYNPDNDPPRCVCHDMLRGCAVMFGCPPHRGFTHGLPVKWYGHGMLNRSSAYMTAPGVSERDKHQFADVNLTHLISALLAHGISHNSSREEVEQAVYHGGRPTDMDVYTPPEDLCSVMPSLALTAHPGIEGRRKSFI